MLFQSGESPRLEQVQQAEYYSISLSMSVSGDGEGEADEADDESVMPASSPSASECE